MLKVLGGIFLLYKLTSTFGSALLAQFPYKFKRLGFSSINLYNTTLEVAIEIENKTNQPVTIQGFEGSLKFSQMGLGGIKRNADILLPPGKKVTASFDVVITNTDFLQELSAQILQPVKPVFRLDGHLIIAGKKLPVSGTFGLQ